MGIVNLLEGKKFKECLDMDKKDIKEIINENIKITGDNIKLGYENMILEKKVEILEEKTKVIKAKKSAQYIVIMMA